MATNVQIVGNYTVETIQDFSSKIVKFVDFNDHKKFGVYFSCICTSRWDCILECFSLVLSMVVKIFELDPLWLRQGLGESADFSASIAPFDLIFDVVVAKRYIYRNPRAQVDILSSFSAISENPKMGKNTCIWRCAALCKLIGVWEIDCGSVLDHPIGLSSCVGLLKRLY